MKQFILPITCGLLLVACAAKSEKASENKEEISSARMESPAQGQSASDNDLLSALSSAAALSMKEDSLHRFVKTANLRFRTKEVIETSLAVEQLFVERSGYIEHSNITSEEKEVNTAPIDDHSEWKITRYTTVSTITARIPADRLNDVLKALHPYVDYLDHRTVEARNIGFDSYLKKLVQERISAHAERFLKAKSPNEKEGLDQLLEREMQSDREKVQDMKLDDQVAYSTVTLSIYGNDKVSKQKVPVFSTEGYEPGFGSRLLDKLETGWKLILGFVLALVSIWPVLVAGGIAWFWWKNRKANSKLKM